MKKVFLFFCVITQFSFFQSPVVNRYLAPAFSPFVSETTVSKGALHVSLFASQASKIFTEKQKDRTLYEHNGILELDGPYRLTSLVTALQKKAEGEGKPYVSPFAREAGGSAWAGRNLVFGAQSSLLLFGANVASEYAVTPHIRCGVDLPFMRVEARERYVFPATKADKSLSVANQEQVQRLRRYVNEDVGLTVGDWTKEGIGDTTVWLSYAQRWGRKGLLRSSSLAGRFAVSLPTSSVRDERYASSIPFGGNGHWGIGVTLTPQAEIKEGWRFACPISFIGQTRTTRVRRLAQYDEADIFSPLKGKTMVQPGFTCTLYPQLTLEHATENLHVTLGWNFTKHWKDRVTDMRSDTKRVPSFVTRTQLPTFSLYSPAKQRELVDNNIERKRTLSSWHTHYITLHAAYELCDLFPAKRYAPLAQFGFDYALSGKNHVRTYTVTMAFSWRF